MSHPKNIITVRPEGIEDGFCWCGCGQRTPISNRSDGLRGIKAGQPTHFLTGHHRRKSPLEYIVADNGCWIWQRTIDGTGYGQTFASGGKSVQAHRAMYERLVGPIPSGLQLDHLCRNRTCVNPAHMEPVPQAINLRRGKNIKLTADQVEQIRRLGGTMPQRRIAELFGITGAHVCSILKGKYWKPAN